MAFFGFSSTGCKPPIRSCGFDLATTSSQLESISALSFFLCLTFYSARVQPGTEDHIYILCSNVYDKRVKTGRGEREVVPSSGLGCPLILVLKSLWFSHRHHSPLGNEARLRVVEDLVEKSGAAIGTCAH